MSELLSNLETGLLWENFRDSQAGFYLVRAVELVKIRCIWSDWQFFLDPCFWNRFFTPKYRRCVGVDILTGESTWYDFFRRTPSRRTLWMCPWHPHGAHDIRRSAQSICACALRKSEDRNSWVCLKSDCGAAALHSKCNLRLTHPAGHRTRTFSVLSYFLHSWSRLQRWAMEGREYLDNYTIYSVQKLQCTCTRKIAFCDLQFLEMFFPFPKSSRLIITTIYSCKQCSCLVVIIQSNYTKSSSESDSCSNCLQIFVFLVLGGAWN